MIRQFKNLGHFVNAVLANVFYGFPSRKLKVVGVTGTDGKTTTATLIYHILNQSGIKVALISTVSAKIGDKEIDTGFHVTTPDPWQLQKLIKRIANERYQYLVLEVTSHGLDQHRLSGINFHIGVLTNITHEHLDYHQDFDSYLGAKANLFRYSRHAVLNRDDASFAPVKALLPPNSLVHPYSLNQAGNQLLASIKAKFPEAYNWSNALAAATAAHLLDIKPDTVYQAIKSFPGVPGRMEKISNDKGITVIVDFAHTPGALESALRAIQKSKVKSQKSKVIAVYGSAGLRDSTKRPMMGDIGSKLADIVVLTAEDPRTEDVNQIISQMKQGATGKAKIYVEPDRQKAIDLSVIKLASKGDIVAVFGKGHEQTMCFGKIEYPWSDHHAVKQSLKKIP